MPLKQLLTQDELDFIQKLQQTASIQTTGASSSLVVNGPSQIQNLLTWLTAHERTTIQAQFENRQVSFPLHLVQDEFNELQLQLGVPTISEDGPKVRPWRVNLEKPVVLKNAKGYASAMWVHEISFEGVLLDLHDQRPAPKRFALQFCPPGIDEPITLRGWLERQTEHGLYAYRLSQSDTDETERLRQYILEQHELAHPTSHL